MTISRFSKAYRPLPHSAKEARNDLRAVLTGWDMADLYDDASVVLVELITNAIRSNDAIDVDLYPSGDSGRLHVEVHDTCQEAPVQQSPGDDEENGRGLLLIAALAKEWGWTPTHDGKIVHAVLERHGS
jgi:anti-sigma regulatory factor (Ser/Thr protein kinase)